MSDKSHSAVIPFSVAVMGIATFSSMDVFMKLLATELGVYNAMLWRTMISMILASILFKVRKTAWPDNSIIKIHLWRGLVISVMACLFFWGLIYVPLAEAIGLSFIAPLIALYLASVLLNEKIGKTAIWASAFGLVGTLIIVGGKLGNDYAENVGMGILAILVSAVLYAYNLILQRKLSLLSGPSEIAFFQNSIIFAIYACFSPFWAVPPPVAQLPNLFAAALLGFFSLLLMSWAYARAEAKILIPVEYTAFIWAALLGWLVFNEEVTLSTLAGTLLIVAGCLVASRQKPTHIDHVETTVV